MDLQEFRDLFANDPDHYPFQFERRHWAAMDQLLKHWDISIEMESLLTRLAAVSSKPTGAFSEDVQAELRNLHVVYKKWRDERRPRADIKVLHPISADALGDALKRVRPPLPEVVLVMHKAFEFAKADRIEIPALFAQKGLSVDQRDGDGITALMECARAGSEKAAVSLLRSGANPHMGDQMGNTALHWAVIQNKRRLAEILLYFGADPNRPNSAGASSFSMSCIKEDTGLMQRLYEYGADLSSQDRLGNTPLHKAVGAGAIESVWLLLVAGAAYAARNKSGVTARENAEKNPDMLKVWDLHQTWLKHSTA